MNAFVSNQRLALTLEIVDGIASGLSFVWDGLKLAGTWTLRGIRAGLRWGWQVYLWADSPQARQALSQTTKTVVNLVLLVLALAQWVLTMAGCAIDGYVESCMEPQPVVALLPAATDPIQEKPQMINPPTPSTPIAYLNAAPELLPAPDAQPDAKAPSAPIALQTMEFETVTIVVVGEDNPNPLTSDAPVIDLAADLNAAPTMTRRQLLAFSKREAIPKYSSYSTEELRQKVIAYLKEKLG